MSALVRFWYVGWFGKIRGVGGMERRRVFGSATDESCTGFTAFPFSEVKG